MKKLALFLFYFSFSTNLFGMRFVARALPDLVVILLEKFGKSKTFNNIAQSIEDTKSQIDETDFEPLDPKLSYEQYDTIINQYNHICEYTKHRDGDTEDKIKKYYAVIFLAQYLSKLRHNYVKKHAEEVLKAKSNNPKSTDILKSKIKMLLYVYLPIQVTFLYSNILKNINKSDLEKDSDLTVELDKFVNILRNVDDGIVNEIIYAIDKTTKTLETLLTNSD